MRTVILDVDLEWLTKQSQKVNDIGGYAMGLVVAYGGNKILLGKTSDGAFTATAEYEDADGAAKSISVRGRTTRDVIERCSKRLHRLGIIVR